MSLIYISSRATQDTSLVPWSRNHDQDMSKWRASEQRIYTLWIFMIWKQSSISYQILCMFILWQCPNFGFTRPEDDSFNLYGTSWSCKAHIQRTHTSKFVLYHLILKYSRGKDSISILASEHLYFLVSSCSTRLKSLQCPDSPSPQNNHCNVSHLQYKKILQWNGDFFSPYILPTTLAIQTLIYKLLSDNDIADILNITWRQIWKLIHDIQGLKQYRLKHSTHYD